MPRIFEVSSAAAGPLPATSPTRKPNWPSGMSCMSKKSPPIERACTDVPADSKNAPLWLPSGNSAFWISAAIFSSCSMRAFSSVSR